MTDKEKLKKIKKLADAMYYAAMYLTTDASRLHKAMDEYHQFIIHECKEEPVSNELEDVSMEWLRPQLDKSYSSYGETKMMELTRFDGYAMLDAIEFGANWQKEKEYTCYEEAFEDGASWKRYEIMKDAVEATVHIDAGGYPYIPQIELYDYDKDVPLAKEGDKYNVVLIKED